MDDNRNMGIAAFAFAAILFAVAIFMYFFVIR